MLRFYMLLLVILTSSLHGETTRVVTYGKSSTVDGYSDILFKEAAEALGYKVETINCPWIRCLRMLASGQLDVLGDVFKTKERQKFAIYLPPYRTENIIFYKKKGSKLQLKVYKDLESVTIGVERGAKYFEPFDSDIQLSKITVSYVDQLFKMLAAGRIELIIGEESSINVYLIRKGLHEEVELTSYRVPTAPIHFAISKKSSFSGQQKQIKKILLKLIENGRADEIYHSYMQKYTIDKF